MQRRMGAVNCSEWLEILPDHKLHSKTTAARTEGSMEAQQQLATGVSEEPIQLSNRLPSYAMFGP